MSPQFDHLLRVLERKRGSSAIYDFLLSEEHVKLTSATEGSFKARLTIEQRHVNGSGSLHGSVSATIVDWAGGLAISTYGHEATGASIDIHVTYLAGARVGDVVEIQGCADKVGKNISFTSVTITKLVGDELGPVVAKGSHTKFFLAKTATN
jgi:acyl-coenzyme A thioesterase 13